MKKHKMIKQIASILFLFLLTGSLATPGQADSGIALSNGQTVYVPIYSHIYSGLTGRPSSLAATQRKMSLKRRTMSSLLRKLKSEASPRQAAGLYGEGE
jgi:hypothetical protein